METIAYGYNDSQWGDRLTSFNNQTITYDAMGNPESYLGKTLSWEGKQLTSVADGTHSYSYSYNEDGLRLRKVVDGTDTEYYYNGSVLMYMITGSGSTAIQQRFSYDAAGNLVAVVYKVGSGTSYIYYYLRNAQGDVVKMIDSSGNTVVEYTYDSWGKLIATTGSLANTVGLNQPFRYRGYVYDEETEFYYLQSRYYDPNTCRFISADVLLSTGQGVIGHNSFAYCGDNPVARFDSSGDFFLSTLAICVVGGAILGGLIGGIAGNSYAKSKGYSGSKRAKYIIGGILGGGIIGAALGYALAPFITTATGVAGISITAKAGVTIIPLHLAGQYHHVLSNRIMNALANHPLRGLFDRAASVIQALTSQAHRGYQAWHRLIDKNMVSWLQNHLNASPFEFWQEMYNQYNTKDMIKRFGEYVLDFIKEQMKIWK